MLDEGEELGGLDRLVHGAVEQLEEQLDSILAGSSDGIPCKWNTPLTTCSKGCNGSIFRFLSTLIVRETTHFIFLYLGVVTLVPAISW